MQEAISLRVNCSRASPFPLLSWILLSSTARGGTYSRVRFGGGAQRDHAFALHEKSFSRDTPGKLQRGEDRPRTGQNGKKRWLKGGGEDLGSAVRGGHGESSACSRGGAKSRPALPSNGGGVRANHRVAGGTGQ